MEHLTAQLAFNLDDQRASIVEMIRVLDPVFKQQGAAKIGIDVRDCDYLGPDAAAILLSTVLQGREKGQQFEVRLPNSPPKLAAFCEFSGLNHWLSGSPKPTMDHPQSVTVPLRQVRRATFEESDPILGLIRRFATIESDSEDALRTCFNEVVQNVEDHSESRIGGVWCARYLSAQGSIRIAVVDRGDGIHTTLRRRHVDTRNAQEALRRVTEGGYSAKSRANNQGIGISHLWNLVHTLNGHMFIVSETAFAERPRKGPARFGSMNTMFPGTGMFFTLPVSHANDK